MDILIGTLLLIESLSALYGDAIRMSYDSEQYHIVKHIHTSLPRMPHILLDYRALLYNK